MIARIVIGLLLLLVVYSVQNNEPFQTTNISDNKNNYSSIMSRNNNNRSTIHVRLEEAKRAKQQYEEQLSQINGYVTYLQKTIPLLKDVEITDTRQESRTITTTTSTMAQRAPTASVDRMVDDDDSLLLFF